MSGLSGSLSPPQSAATGEGAGRRPDEETSARGRGHVSECQVTFRDTGRAHEQQPVGVLVDLGHHTLRMLELEDRADSPATEVVGSALVLFGLVQHRNSMDRSVCRGDRVCLEERETQREGPLGVFQADDGQGD